MENVLNLSNAQFQFKQVKGKRGIKFRKTDKRPNGTGTVLEVEHNGHDHITLDFRTLYKQESGKIGNKRIMFWTLNTKETVQLASLLFLMADEYMRDSAESPYELITTKERAGFGTNWIHDDYKSAMQRTENRKSRSYLFGLMKRFVEKCDTNDGFLSCVLLNLSLWANQSGDEFAVQQAEKAFSQLGLLPQEILN